MQSNISILSKQEWLDIANTDQSKTTGIQLKPGEEIAELRPYLVDIPLIVIEMESFSDGRVYSMAIELGKKYRFKNKLKVTGANQDCMEMLLQCGVDYVEFADGTEHNIKISAPPLCSVYPLQLQK